MPPWERHRGNKRIDAAIDALTQFGFQQSTICKTINELLKIYGGDNGWPFVEEASYQLVIDTILEKQDEDDNETKAVTQVLDGCIAHAEEDDQETEADPRVRDAYMVHAEEAVVEAIDAVPAHVECLSLTTPRTCGPTAGVIGWKDTEPNSGRFCDHAVVRSEVPSPDFGDGSSSPSHQPPSSPPQRPPCYGYISESEEEGDGPNEEAVENGSGPGPSHQGRGRRKSRWDEKPAGN